MSLYRDHTLSINDPLFQVIPHSVGRLKSLYVMARPEILHQIIAHLPSHMPLLEKLDISGTFCSRMLHCSPFMTTFFSGDLSSLRVLRLECIRTELSWRNMVNLTSVVLRHTSPGGRLSGLPSPQPQVGVAPLRPRVRHLSEIRPAMGLTQSPVHQTWVLSPVRRVPFLFLGFYPPFSMFSFPSYPSPFRFFSRIGHILPLRNKVGWRYQKMWPASYVTGRTFTRRINIERGMLGN